MNITRDRIMFSQSRFSVSPKHVNPISLKKVELIHKNDKSPQANPSKLDLT